MRTGTLPYFNAPADTRRCLPCTIIICVGRNYVNEVFENKYRQNKSEVIPIPDIRERNDRPKDNQPKHQVASTVQRQMVQKFVKELNDSAKQPNRSDSTEHTATEQVETTAREIVHNAVQLPRSFSHQTPRAKIPEQLLPEQPALPRQTSATPQQRAEEVRSRPDTTPLRTTPAPTPQEQGRHAYVQQAAKAATAPPITPKVPQKSLPPVVPLLENVPRQAPETPRLRPDDIRLRSEPEVPQHMPTPAPQEQGRRAFVQQAAEDTAKAPVREPLSERPSVSDTPSTEKMPRLCTDDVRTRPDAQKPHNTSAPTAQEQGRRSYVRQSKKSRAENSSARDNFHTEPPEIRLSENLPVHEPPRIREKPTITELRSELPPEATPEKAPNIRHIKQAGAWTPRAAEPSTMRGEELPIRERIADTPTHDLPSIPQVQARKIFAEKQAQLSQNPSIESTNPSEQAAPILPQPPVSDAPTITPERQSVTTGSGKPASPTPQPVHPIAPPQIQPTEHLPSIREKSTPNAAPREASRRGVDIRTKDMASVGTSKVQPKTSLTKAAGKQARKAATQDAQRKMLQKSNSHAARAAIAATKKLAEAAAKAVKELISALASLGGGTALFVVFSIVIVAGAFLASPRGILFADEQESDDTVPLATAIAEIQGEYHSELERLQNGDFSSVQIIGQAPDWREVVAMFASKVAGAEDGMDVFTLDEERVELLRQVFWDMCEITTATQTVFVPDSDPNDDVDDSHTETALTITITSKTAEQMRLEYSFTKYQNDALDILLENLGSLNVPMGSLNISQEDAIELLENLPDDLDPERKAVVETAVQLVGRVSYFWGGKSLTLGWDDRWGVPTEVTAAGSGSTGTIRPFGLDCSGFVDWTFYNATNGSYYPGRGGGAATQHSYCTNIAWSDAQPGDLVFYPDDSHVGIVGGKDADGNLLIVHCSGGANGVVITGSAGFTVVARPDFFS